MKKKNSITSKSGSFPLYKPKEYHLAMAQLARKFQVIFVSYVIGSYTSNAELFRKEANFWNAQK